MTDYQATLDFLYRQLPMYQRVGATAFKKDLTNIRALLEELGNPHEQFASIHIAGTNGKGSVAHLMAAALQAGGMKTGLYTSPHYKDFRERIRIDGQQANTAFVVDFVKEIKPLLETIRPSFFEITVAMAFTYFARQEVDIAVVEVGLGGRLDSTNVLTPELSVITNISFDHQQFLGDTLPLIAGEKAGIIKPGVPLVVGETQEETAPIFRRIAKEKEAPLVFADQRFWARPVRQDLANSWLQVARQQRPYFSDLQVNLRGPYQHLNIQTALTALEVWQEHQAKRFLPFKAIEKGWRELRKLTGFQGRWQVIGEQPIVLVDSAHNEAGIQYVMDYLKEWSGQVHIVLGVVNDKDLAKMLPLYLVNARYYFAKADIPRGLAADQLQATAKEYDLSGRAYMSVRNALKAAKGAADKDDLIFVGGSIFTVAEVI